MGHIQELSEQLANQIAAGEVVERPASVVKELVENAIDANSHRIVVQLKESGLGEIRVIDDGEGIAPDEVELAFKRHATSKIKTRRDLFRVQTLGFRGEALPSIASVSKVVMTTAKRGESAGTRLELDYGKLVDKGVAPLRYGTDITITQLFHNTPARLKHMKSMPTELSQVGNIMNRLALSHPDISFQLDNGDTNLLKTSGSGDLKQVIAQIYKVSTAKKMIPIAAENFDFRVKGYVSLPEETRANKNYISFILNGRYVRNYDLVKALIAGYGTKLMVGRFPIAVIEIELDPFLVDVNVHPTKQEVRLSKEEDLKKLLQQAVSEALAEQVLIPDALSHWKPKETKTVQTTPLPLQTNSPLTPTEEEELNHEVRFVEQQLQEAEDGFISQSTTFNEEPVNYPAIDKAATPVVEQHPVPKEKAASLTEKPSFPWMEYFGQMHGTYLFAQGEDGLYIIDQHAAQERIKYEYYRVAIGDVSADQQQLLVPITLDFTVDEALKIQEGLPALQEVGLYLEPFGQNTFIIHSHPSWLSEDVEKTIRQMIDGFLRDGKFDVAKFREKTAIMMSCKRSIKANHHLDDEQARRLIHDLSQCQNPFNCPHGRPVIIHLSNSDIEKMFKRIQDPH